MKHCQEEKIKILKIPNPPRIRNLVGLVLALLIIWAFGFGTPDAYAGWTDGKYNSAIDFNGTSTYIDGFGALGNIKAVSFWIKADNLTNYMMDLNGTQTITVSSGTILANNFTSPTIYVDGGISSTLADTNWHHIAIITDTDVNASAVVVGKVGANYFDGVLDDVRIYNYACVADEIRADYNAGKAAHFGENNQRSDGLVVHWNFEEGSGQTIYDRSGNSNDGTLGANSSVGKDDPVFAAGHDSNGPGGMGMDFDGVDDYVQIPDDESLDLTVMTFSAWIYRGATNTYSNTIFCRNNDYDRRIFASVDYFYSQFSDINYTTAAGTAPTSQWIHFVYILDSVSDYEQFYIDGSPMAANSGNNVNNFISAVYDINIGTWTSAQFPFDGLIDDVRIYNRALSADEIRQLYNQKKPVMELKFDEGSGTTAYDESWNNNDATFPAVDGNKPEWSAP